MPSNPVAVIADVSAALSSAKSYKKPIGERRKCSDSIDIAMLDTTASPPPPSASSLPGKRKRNHVEILLADAANCTPIGTKRNVPKVPIISTPPRKPNPYNKKLLSPLILT